MALALRRVAVYWRQHCYGPDAQERSVLEIPRQVGQANLPSALRAPE
jgi:hypothetical protein